MKTTLIILFTCFIFELGFCQKHNTFQVGKSCDSTTIANQLIGTWSDTLNPAHTLELTNKLDMYHGLIFIENGNITGEWSIIPHSIKEDSICEFKVNLLVRDLLNYCKSSFLKDGNLLKMKGQLGAYVYRRQ